MTEKSDGGLRSLFVNQREERLRAGWRLAAVVPAILAAAILAGFPQFAILSLSPPSGPLAAVAFAVAWLVFYGALTAVVLAMARWLDRRPWRAWFEGARSWTDLLAGLVVGVGMATAAVLAGLVAGDYRVADALVVDPGAPLVEVSALAIEVGTSHPLLVVGVLFAFHVGVGAFEEVLVRGSLLTNLAEGLAGVGRVGARGALAFAVLATSLLFGVLHLANPGADLVSTANIVLAGLFFAGTYVATGSLGIPIGLHVAWNFALAGVYGLPVSGLRAGGSLLAVESVGDAAVTGGGFGPEAGFVFYPALAVGVLASLAWIRYSRDGVAVHEGIARYVPPASIRDGHGDD